MSKHVAVLMGGWSAERERWAAYLAEPVPLALPTLTPQ